MLKAEAMKARREGEPAAHEEREPRPEMLQGDQALQVFYDFFPNIDSSPFWIGEVVQIAVKQGVEINGTEYRMVREKDLKLARYEMVVPVRGQLSPRARFHRRCTLRAVPGNGAGRCCHQTRRCGIRVAGSEPQIQSLSERRQEMKRQRRRAARCGWVERCWQRFLLPNG